MPTFHEVMNTVRFRAIAGWAKREADLWPLRDLLFGLQTDIQKWGVNISLNLKKAGTERSEVDGHDPVVPILEVLEHDIMVIGTYCASRHIPRP